MSNPNENIESPTEPAQGQPVSQEPHSDSDTTAPSPNPFRKKKRNSSPLENPYNKKNAAKWEVIIHAIKPHDGDCEEQGFLIQATGWAEKACTDPYFDKHDDGNKEWIKNTDLHPFVFFPLDGNGKRVQNYRNHDAKALFMPSPGGLDEDTIRDWVKDIFLVELEKLGTCGPSQMPEISDGPEAFKYFSHWADVLEWKSIAKIFNAEFLDDTSMKNWLQASKKNVYTIWPKGGVPANRIRAFALKKKHLDELDHNKVSVN